MVVTTMQFDVTISNKPQIVAHISKSWLTISDGKSRFASSQTLFRRESPTQNFKIWPKMVIRPLQSLTKCIAQWSKSLESHRHKYGMQLIKYMIDVLPHVTYWKVCINRIWQMFCMSNLWKVTCTFGPILREMRQLQT